MLSKGKHTGREAGSSMETEKAARAEAEAASRMKDEFLATISHELRTPLTAILLWSRILRDGKVNEQDRREAIETIERSAMAQAEMIEDLLDISRMLSGKVRLNAKRFEMTPAVQAAVHATQVLADARGVTLQTELDPRGASVFADPVRVQQIVWNLLSHSVRSTPEGGQVTVQLQRNDGHMRMQITDTGFGMNAAALEGIFKETGTDSSNARHQSALGLVLARQLVELHGGTIHAESDGDGKGAKYTVVLPSAGQEGAAAASARTISRSGDSPADLLLKNLRILLVEDEADTRNVIRWLLEQAGAQVTALESASKAMELLTGETDHLPEILVSDIGMAGEDGNDLIRKIRGLDSRDNPTARIPAIAITAYSREADRRRALRAGYTAFMAKPIDADELVLLIASLTGRAKSIRPGK